MYNQTYEEYIRNILGYQPNNQMDSMYQPNYQMAQIYDRDYNYANMQREDLEGCYPEIYKVVYPMVEKACRSNSKPVTKELIDDLTNEIYMSIEGNQEVHININLQNEVENRNSNTKTQNKNESKTKEEPQNRETRQFNRGLIDIIRILLIRELLGRPGFPGNRPPIPPPNRPPFRPGRPPMRPPYNRDFDDIYEY